MTPGQLADELAALREAAEEAACDCGSVILPSRAYREYEQALVNRSPAIEAALRIAGGVAAIDGPWFTDGHEEEYCFFCGAKRVGFDVDETRHEEDCEWVAARRLCADLCGDGVSSLYKVYAALTEGES